MYKSVSISILVAIAAYFTYRIIPTSHSVDDHMALASVSRHVIKKVLAVETPEELTVSIRKGVGALVRRSIGSMSLRNLTPFLMLDHFHVSKGAVRVKRGLVTIRKSQHEDSAGHKGTIGTLCPLYCSVAQYLNLLCRNWRCPMDVRRQSIIHAEMPVHKDGASDPRGLQLWIDLPKEVRHHLTYVTDARVLICVSPLVQNGGTILPSLSSRYVSHPNFYRILRTRNLAPTSKPKFRAPSPKASLTSIYRIPTAFPEGPDGPVKIKVISGKSYGVESPVRPHGGNWFFHVIYNKKGPSIFQDIRKCSTNSIGPFSDVLSTASGWTAFIYGSVLVGSETIPHEAFHTLVLSHEEGETGVQLAAGQDGTEFVVVRRTLDTFVILIMFNGTMTT
ncbi:pirin domain-containing protein [Salix suchowensis]|nr:pirin domain-containing protein [Salix suchowensis]